MAIPAFIGAILHGGSLVLNLEAHSASDTALSPGTALVRITFENDGQLTIKTTTETDEWLRQQPISSTTAGLFEVALTAVTGDGPTTGAAIGTYQSLDISRIWELSRSSIGVSSGTWTFRVRNIANPSWFVEADITVDVEVTP